MPGIESLIRSEADGTISFGDYSLNTKSKLQDFEHAGDLYKIKTFYEITKLEGSDEVAFTVGGYRDSQITVQMEADTEYEVFVDGSSIGHIKTNMSGKLAFSVSLNDGAVSQVKIVRQ